MKKSTKSVLTEVGTLTVGELIVSALVILAYFILSLFTEVRLDHTVFIGVALGTVVTVANYVFLSVSVNRAVDKFLEIRGSKKMDDDEAEAFAAKHSLGIQNTLKLSFIIRTVTMLATLIAAFVTKLFNPVATLVPLIMFRPILTVIELIKRRSEPKPDPDNFVYYSEEDEQKEGE